MEARTTRPPQIEPIDRTPSVPFSERHLCARPLWPFLLASAALISLAVAQSFFILSRLEGLSGTAEMLLLGALLIAFLCPAFHLLILRPLHRQKVRFKEAEIRIRTLAFYDSLTGLPNRLLLRERAGQAFALARRKGRSMAVIFLDLDDFKQVNDAFGHAAGDAYLKAVSERLTRSVRETDTVARIGGDEFVWLGMVGDYREAEAIARKILQSLTRTIAVGENSVRIGASIGIAVHPRDGDDLEALIRAADAAMYDAKKGGKNSFHFCESRHYDNSSVRESAYSYFRD